MKDLNVGRNPDATFLGHLEQQVEAAKTRLLQMEGMNEAICNGLIQMVTTIAPNFGHREMFEVIPARVRAFAEKIDLPKETVKRPDFLTEELIEVSLIEFVTELMLSFVMAYGALQRQMGDQTVRERDQKFLFVPKAEVRQALEAMGGL